VSLLFGEVELMETIQLFDSFQFLDLFVASLRRSGINGNFNYYWRGFIRERSLLFGEVELMETHRHPICSCEQY